MKLLGYIIISISLCIGTLAATTAYVPRLEAVESTVDDPETQLVLNANAGAVKSNAGTLVQDARGNITPLFKRDTAIDREVYDALKANGVTRVRVKEFSFVRWQHAWMFGVAVLGLIVGGVMVKAAQRKDIARRVASATRSSESPEAALSGVGAVIESLATLPEGHETNERIVREVGELQQTHLRVLSESRALLVGRLGMGGYAQFMDRFSAMERQLNRSWSAAADEYPSEAYTALHAARALFPEVKARLQIA